MENQIIAAVFPDHGSAERAIQNLRNMGVPDTAMSIIASHQGHTEATTAGGDKLDHVDADNKGSGTAKGITYGAITGALFGLAAAAIPGVGPFITAGALAEALGAAGGSAAAGAIVGGTAGGVVGLLEKYGLSSDEAKHYSQHIEKGGVFVGVSTAGAGYSPDMVRQALATSGGHMQGYMA